MLTNKTLNIAKGGERGVQKHLFNKINKFNNINYTQPNMGASHDQQCQYRTNKKKGDIKEKLNIQPISKLRMQHRDQSKQSQHSHINTYRQKETERQEV